MKAITHPIHLVAFHVEPNCPYYELRERGEENPDILCYSDTFLNAFQIITTGEFEYLIFDMSGNELEKGKGKERAEVGEGLKMGRYMVQVRSTTKSKFMRLEKN